MTETAATTPIRIAIIGGGLAGATLANALVQISNLQVFVFESAPTFSERGAAVGLPVNAQHALQHVFFSLSSFRAPSASNARSEDNQDTYTKDLLSRAGAVPMNSSRVMLGSGLLAGTVLADMAGASDPGLVVHRASLLRELLAPLVPMDGVLHANKKLSSIQQNGEKTQVTFLDGTTETFDGVIGADGIFSTVRDYVLEDHDPQKHAASPAGFWDCRVLVPYEKAKAIIGPEHFEIDRQFAWIGDDAFILHDILEHRTMVQCIISAVEEQPSLSDDGQPDINTTTENRKRPLTREFLTKTLDKWLNGPIAKGIIDLVLDQPSTAHSYSQYEHKTTPTYCRSNVCIIGDAAHATTPFQGAGAGQAFEDAMVLGALLRKVKSADEIAAAFRAYDTVRRPRCQRVIDSSREMGRICCGAEVGLDPDDLRAAMAGKWEFLFGLDFGEYKARAVGLMREELGRGAEGY